MQTLRDFKQVFFRLMESFSRKQKIRLVLIFVLLAVCAILAQFTPKAIGWITDDILSASSLDFVQTIPLLAAILAISVLHQLLSTFRRLLVEDMACHTEKRARSIAIASLLKAPLSYFRQNMTGSIHGRLNRCLDGTVKLEKIVFMDLAPALFNSIAAIVVIFSSVPLMLAAMMMLVIPIGIVIVLRQIQTQKGIRVSLLKQKAEMDGAAVELLQGIEVIRICDSVDLEEKRFAKKSESIRSQEMNHHKAMAFYDFLKFLNECIFTVLTIGISAWLASKHVISVGTVLTAYLCFLQLLTPLQELHRILDELSENLILTEDFFSIVDIPHDFSYAADKKEGSENKECKAGKENKTGSQQMAEDGIHASDISLCYEESEPVFEHLCLDIQKGEFIGFAGPSGCGKSSLIKAVCRLEPCSGSIQLDGTSLSKMSRADIADKITLVPQNPFIIAGTLKENICYGSKIEPDENHLDWVLQQSCLKEFADSLPDGVNSQISEGGRNLSGGQKQRIALARIFLRVPEILILDEATSALDNTTERIIQHNIEQLAAKNNMTVLAIAHRLTTLQNCTRIYVLEEGKIVQEGTYDQLIEEDGLFAKMHHGILASASS